MVNFLGAQVRGEVPGDGACQWCKRIFALTVQQKIPQHRNPGEKFNCLGSEQIPLHVKRAGA